MQTDVLIVGAGPTGLALACQLIRYGIDFVIIDKNETTTQHSKAIGVQARTIEIYEQIGLADKLIELGAIAEKATMFAGGKIRGQIEFRDLGKGMSPYPYLLIVEQGKHETLIYDFIKSHGKNVLWKTTLESFTQDAAGVRATVVNSSGSTETIEAKYLVGCDGAKSSIRHALGLTFEGSTFERLFYVADVEIDWEFEHGGLHIFLMKNSLLAVFAMDGERQYRIVGTFPQEFEKDEGEVLYEEIEERIRLDADIEFDITHVNWFSTYKVHTRHVNKFSEGRCFLAGDSAHIHTPAGAQGMNTGIQDGYNLAWKIALVLNEKANERILDTYNEERLPNAETLMKTTDRFFNLVASPNPFLVFTRIYIFPYVAQFLFSLNVVKRFVFPRISQIAINYRNSSLSNNDGSFKLKAGDRMPYFLVDGESIYDRLHEPKFHVIRFSNQINNVNELDFGKEVDVHAVPTDAHIVEIFGTKGAFTVLLRPDNYIGYIGEGIAREKIRDYLDGILMQ